MDGEALDKLFEDVNRLNIEYIDLLFTSITSKTHLVSIPVDELEDAVKYGVGFDGSSAGFVSVEVSDLLLRPDPKTFTVEPWVNKPRTGLMIAEVYHGSKPFSLDPRNILKRAIRRLKSLLGENVDYVVSPEIEFWLFKPREDGSVEFHDRGSYCSIPPEDKGHYIRKEIASTLDKMGIHPVKIHHEVPPAKHEIDFRFGDALKIADATVIYKFTVKCVANLQGLIASFMPKPFYGEYGAGMHTHQSLMNTSKGENLFYGGETGKLSDTALYYIAGLLSHAKGITAITNPTVNSYKRLVPGWEAPVYIVWAWFNRSALIRVPMTTEPRKVRLEYRATDGSCNPYLAYAAMLTAGVEGIKKKLQPPPPVEEDVYRMGVEERKNKGIEVLPSTLREALEEMKRDPISKEILGEAYEMYLKVKSKEWFEYNVMVHEWERRRYLTL